MRRRPALLAAATALAAGACSGTHAATPDATPDAAPAAVAGDMASLWDGFAVVLHLSAAGDDETITVDHAGPFAFARALPPGTAYTVDVATPPPGHTCTVTGGSGTVGGTPVHVDCRVVTGLAISIPNSLAFDPATIQYDVTGSDLATATTITVTAPLADAITIDSVQEASGAPSQAFLLPEGDRVFTIAVTVGVTTHFTFVHVTRGGTPIAQVAYVKAPINHPGALFGSAVSADGDTLLVGAPGDDGGRGAAYSYRRTGTTWAYEGKLVALDGAAGDQFGAVLQLVGDQAFVGAPGASSGAGAVYELDRSGATWTQVTELHASNPAAGDHFGASLSVDGNDLLVGAPGEDSSATGIGGDQQNDNAPDSGAAYLFTRTAASTWTQTSYAKATNTDPGDAFGTAVDLHAGTATIGAPEEDSNGTESDNSVTDSGALYSYSVTGHVLGVPSAHYRKGVSYGSPGFPSHAGRSLSHCDLLVPVVEGEANLASPVAGGNVIRAIPYPGPADIGASLGCQNNVLIMGAPLEPGAGAGIDPQLSTPFQPRGAIYAVDLSNPQPDGAKSYSMHYIKASNPDTGDAFGSAVAISDGAVVAGAPHESSTASGIDGDQTDNNSKDSGAVYVFR